jgi:hypothetical protein
MPAGPLLIESSNLSLAWGQALMEVLDHPIGECRPMVVSVGGFSEELPPEDHAIRKETDRLLKSQGCNSCDVSAMVIFPYKLWLRRLGLSCEEFCGICVNDYFPRLAALNKLNRHGTYFLRMMNYKSVKNGSVVSVDQVSQVVDRLRNKSRFRATGLQMTCFNPATDHNRQPRLGFPCLQHVGITHEGENGIAITGFYPSQHLFDRAYGNYLGLAHLGHFLAHHSGHSLDRVTCIATRPLLGTNRNKGALKGLKKLIEERMEAVA